MKPVKHRTLSTILLVFTAVFLATSKCVNAAPIYSQVLPEEPSAAFGSNDSPISQKVADNFSLSGSNPITVRSLRFIGGSGLANPVPDEFRVIFLEDAGGTPGLPLSGSDFNIGSAFSRTPTGGQLLNGVTIPQEYIINLPDGITLSPNTTYWLSITNSLLPNNGWAWARAGGVFDQEIASTTGVVATGPWTKGASSGGLWFELNDQIIPEPSSFVLLLLSLMATAIPRSRHWQRGSRFASTLT